jgi:gas vesicle protein
MNIPDWFEDVLPIKRKSAADWALPALLGLAAGIAVGAGLGLLYAPSTGEETRLKLRRGATRAKEKAGEIAERAKDRISSAGAAADRQLERSS